MSRWQPGEGSRYAARFAALAAAGAELHGEADLCASLAPIGARILDAGCGTGRVAIELRRRGYECVGVDLDHSMLAEARRADPDGSWLHADLADFELGAAGLQPFDLVVAAGNILPLVAAGTEAAVVERLAAALRPGGLLVTGFGLDHAQLPPGAAVHGLAEFDRWCVAAGMTLHARFATWEGKPYAGGGYAVTVGRRT